MDTAKLLVAGAYAAGLVLTLFLAAYLTPRHWWRRPNARALLVMVVGAWGFGSLILALPHGLVPGSLRDAPAQPTAQATQPAPPSASEADIRQSAANAIISGLPFQVHRDLNLRAGAGVHAARLVTVPVGATVTPTGRRSGDWWQVSARVAGRDNTGWVSSLWLRRSGE
jgi:hypothetical protein